MPIECRVVIHVQRDSMQSRAIQCRGLHPFYHSSCQCPPGGCSPQQSTLLFQSLKNSFYSIIRCPLESIQLSYVSSAFLGAVPLSHPPPLRESFRGPCARQQQVHILIVCGGDDGGDGDVYAVYKWHWQHWTYNYGFQRWAQCKTYLINTMCKIPRHLFNTHVLSIVQCPLQSHSAATGGQDM